MGNEVNITDELIKSVYATSFSDIDETSIARAKMRLIDAMGVIAIGRKSPDTAKLVSMLQETGGKEECTVATFGCKLPMEAAAFANAILMRSFDFEPIDAESLVEGGPTTAAHISGSTIPAALAVAEVMHSSGEELLRAIILGDDAAARALNASCFTVHDRFDGNGTANLLGATIAVGLLLGLTPEEMKGAISVAVNEMSGSMQTVFEKTIVFKFPIAASARNAIFAAKLAQIGYVDCMADPLGGPRGFFEMYYTSPKPELMLQDLGKKFIADAVIKPWPACRATHASINAVLGALDGKKFAADEVASLKVHIQPGTKLFVGQGFEFGMSKSFQGAFSIDFLTATAVLRGSVKPEFFTPECMTDPELGKILSKTELIDDEPEELGPLACDAEITLADGTVLSHRVLYPLGDFYRTRLTKEQFFDKFWSNIAYGGTVSEDNAKQLVETLENLETLEDASIILGLLS